MLALRADHRAKPRQCLISARYLLIQATTATGADVIRGAQRQTIGNSV